VIRTETAFRALGVLPFMNGNNDAAPEIVACHEAGHLVVARLCDRQIQKVSLKIVDGKRGCYYEPAPDTWTDYEEFLTLLAGPCAQTHVYPWSVVKWKLEAFRERIVQPKNHPQQIPAIYDYTGWKHDIEPVYVLMQMPDAPAFTPPPLVTRTQALQRAEERLRHAFSANEVQRKIEQIADVLFLYSPMTGADATELVGQTHVLELPPVQQLNWDAA